MLVVWPLSDVNRLLSLLGGSGSLATSVAVDIGSIGSLDDDTLDGSPTLADSWWHILAVGHGVTTGSKLVDGSLDEGALVEASAEEDAVDGKHDPRTLQEEETRSKKAEPKNNLKDGNNGHGGIVVVLNEVAYGICES